MHIHTYMYYMYVYNTWTRYIAFPFLLSESYVLLLCMCGV